MKKYIHTKTVILVFAMIGIVGCTKFFDKIDDFNIGVASTIFEQSAVIKLTDYSGDQADISNTDFTVTFTGADADKLVNEAGEFALTETQGFIQLNVNPNKSIGVKELNFNLTVSGGTYRTATFPISLKDSTSFIQLQMVNEAKMVGTDKTTSTASLTNDATTTTITVATTAAKSTNTSSVTIDAGTQFKDASGALINGGDVKVSLTNVDPIGEIIDPIYRNVKEFKDASGTVISDKTPVLNGRTSITMEIGGKQVKKFDKPIAVVITIPSENPTTGNTVQLGDTYPIYTNEEGSKEWTYYATGTVTAGADANTFNVKFNTTHLSSYTLVTFKDDSGSCYSNYTYQITAPNAIGSGVFNIKVKLSIKDSNFAPVTTNLFEITVEKGVIKNIKPYDEFQHAMGFYPMQDIIKEGGTYITGGYWESTLELYFNDTYLGNDFSGFSTVTNCEFNINLTAQFPANLKDINIDVAANCNGNTLVPDGFPIYVERENGQFSYQGTIKNGKVTLKGFELNKEYNFKTVYKGKSYFHKWTFTSTSFVDKNFSIPDTVCSEIGF